MKDYYIALERKTIIGSGVVGAIIGAFTWGLNLLLQKYFVEPVFCRNADSFGACANGGVISFNTALLLLAIVAVVALVRIGGYRPLLVVIAAVVTLWSANRWLGVQSWWEATMWLSLLSAIAYIAYSWIARIAVFPVSLALMVVIVILARLIVSNA